MFYKQTKEAVLTSASLSADSLARFHKLLYRDAYPNHDKIHSAALMYAGYSSDEDFLEKCRISFNAMLRS